MTLEALHIEAINGSIHSHIKNKVDKKEMIAYIKK